MTTPVGLDPLLTALRNIACSLRSVCCEATWPAIDPDVAEFLLRVEIERLLEVGLW